MKNLTVIKNQFQIIEDNLGLAINDLVAYQAYRQKQDAEDLLKALAVWYENNPPLENISFKMDIPIELVLGSQNLSRIHAAFSTSNKIFTLYCTGGEA